jgi:hypothetical protein
LHTNQTPPYHPKTSDELLDGHRRKAHDPRMVQVRKTDSTIVCEKCGAAMVIVRIWEMPDDREVHMFRCEICDETAFFRSKPKAPPKIVD